MTTAAIAWPMKTREQQHVIWDSTRWNDFRFRDDDIIIATWSKAGTTWLQQMVAQLVFEGADDVYGQAISPWIDFRLTPDASEIAEAQTHRRFMKTHLPLDALVFSPKAKYLYVARDVRDVVFSMFHHQHLFTPGAYEAFNGVPGRVGPLLGHAPDDVREYYRIFMEEGRLPGMFEHGFWAHVQGWWDARTLPNVLLVHYANLKSDLAGEMRRMADFLDIDIPGVLWPKILDHCGIEYMRGQAAKWTLLEMMFEGGGNTFINKGVNGRWKDVLSASEIARADELSAANLTPDCAHWLKTGELRAWGTA